jgi:hypothetical protein
MAWCSSISNGYNAPAFGTGALAVLLISYVYHAIQSMNEKNGLRKFSTYLLIVLLSVSAYCYWISRHAYIYEDKPARELTYPMDGLLPGGYGLKTNQNTYEFFVDFKEALEKTKGRDFTLVPGLPAY